MTEVEGVVTAVETHGSITLIWIDSQSAPLSADTNEWIRSGAFEAIQAGAYVQAGVADWGGMEWIAPSAPEGGTNE